MAEDEEAPKISKFNSAMFQNFRMHEVWIDANKHSRAGDYKKWNEDLDRIWSELVGDVKEDSEEEEKYERLSDDYSEKVRQLQKKGFKDYTKLDLQNLFEQKKILMKKEAFLRRLQNKQGKGTAYDEEDDDFE